MLAWLWPGYGLVMAGYDWLTTVIGHSVNRSSRPRDLIQALTILVIELRTKYEMGSPCPSIRSHSVNNVNPYTFSH